MATPNIYLPSEVLTQAATAGHERIYNAHWQTEQDKQDSIVASAINAGNASGVGKLVNASQAMSCLRTMARTETILSRGATASIQTGSTSLQDTRHAVYANAATIVADLTRATERLKQLGGSYAGAGVTVRANASVSGI
jgi:hypothetical protein